MKTFEVTTTIVLEAKSRKVLLEAVKEYWANTELELNDIDDQIKELK